MQNISRPRCQPFLGNACGGNWEPLISWLATSVDGDGVEASRILNFNQSIFIDWCTFSCIVVLRDVHLKLLWYAQVNPVTRSN
jgi:hypothetical protein